jgi:hypothetical protein
MHKKFSLRISRERQVEIQIVDKRPILKRIVGKCDKAA